jgi:hypothetical protein
MESNVTKIVSISVALFAAITQVLDAIGAISLSTTQQVTIWLVAAGLIVLLSIADMACGAYVTAATYRSGEPSVATPNFFSAPVPGQAEQPPPEPPPVIPTDRPGTRTPVSLTDGNAGDDASAPQNGPRLPVKMADVFPGGCYLVPHSISETFDYDEKTKTHRPSIDEITGKRVYQCRVVDMDPERKGRSRETVVKIVADQMPVPPTQAPYESVEFEGLTAIPYATDPGRAAYASLCATGIEQAITRPVPGTAVPPGTPSVPRPRSRSGRSVTPSMTASP